MAFPTYPAITLPQAEELIKYSGNQLHDIINGTDVETIDAEDGPIPSVRKVFKDQDDIFQDRIAGMAFTRVGTFTAGYTLTDARQVLLYETDGHEYGWAGAFPKVVPSASTPAGTGGVGAGAWVDRSDVTLRSDLNVVVKVFESVADMVADATLIVGQKCRTLGYYAVGDGGGNDYIIVAAATGTDDGGSYIDLSGSGFQAKGLFKSGIINVKQFGAVGDGIADDTIAFRGSTRGYAGLCKVTANSDETYLIKIQPDNKCVEITNKIEIDLNGAGVIYKPWSDSDPGLVHSPCFYIHGSVGPSHNIGDEISNGNSVTLTTISDSLNYSIGDVVIIKTTALTNPWNYPKNNQQPYLLTGEIHNIKDVNNITGVITLTRNIDDKYPSQATIQKINQISDVKISNFSAVEIDSDTQSTKTLSGDVGHLVSIEYCDGPEVSNITCYDFRMFCVWLGYNTDSKVDGVSGIKNDNGKYSDIGGHAYVIRHHGCIRSTTRRCLGVMARHTIDYTGGSDHLQEFNSSENNKTSYLTHGYHARRINSNFDRSFNSDAGWSYQNTSFNGDYDGVISNFKYIGNGYSAILVGSNSENVSIINPNIKINGSSITNAIRVTSGAKNVTVSGGTIDCSNNSNVSTNSIIAVAGSPDFDGYSIASASATAGFNPTVTVNTSSANDFEIGDQIYISLDDVALNEYGGYFSVSNVISPTTFEYIVSGTTTQNLSITSSPLRHVYSAENFKPVESIKINGVSFVSHGSQGRIISISSRDYWIVSECHVKSSSASTQFIFSNNIDCDQNPKNIEVKGNIINGDVSLVCQLERVGSISTILDDNVCTSYSGYAFTIIPSLSASASWVGGLSIARNKLHAASPLGAVNLNLWDYIKSGAYVSGNTYPLNASILNSLNKNYEKGSFTPYLEGLSSAGTASYVSQIGRYSLSGKSIIINLNLNLNSFNGTGTMAIKGIPYSNAGIANPCSVVEVNGLAFSGILMPNWTSGYISLRQNNAGSIGDVPSDDAFAISLQSILQLQ